MIEWLRSLVQHNIMAKLLALVVAVILWGIAMDEQNPPIEKEYIIPIEMVNAPHNYKITKADDALKIKVRAQRSNYTDIDSNDFKAQVNLEGLAEGTFDAAIQLHLPTGFEVIGKSLESTKIVMDPFIEKQMKTEIVVTGLPASGAVISQISQANPNVTIVGPKSAVSLVARIVGCVELTNNDTDFKFQVPLFAVKADGKDVEGVRVIPSVTEVNVQLARGLSKKIVSVHAVMGEDLPAGYKVESVRVTPEKIEIAGDSEVLKELKSVDTGKIPLKDKTGSFQTKASLALPEGVTVTNSVIDVQVAIKKIKGNPD
mgnify:CR=1 FL=1